MTKVAIVLGVGPGIGGNLALKWAKEGYKVVCVCRTEEKCEDWAKQCGGVSIPGDVTREDQMEGVFATAAKYGTIETVLFNSGSGVFKQWTETSHEELEKCLATNIKGLFIVAHLVWKYMETTGGTFGITGATASLRGKPFTCAFAASKGGQRMMAQGLARDLGKKGIHVFYAIIDGIVDLPTTKERFPQIPEEKYMSPAAIAQQYWNVHVQDKSVWTFEIDLRPMLEDW
jgi:NAD(P)-dependent dehydrogenase (short-subunit alcohol dehydrogenase family)